jgi:AcrR family transcriptional regulator
MVLVHKVFRREFGMLPALIGGVEPGDSVRAVVVGAHARELMTALRRHHDAERELLWRRLRDRGALDEPLQQRLADWHREHFALLTELDGLLPLWQESAALDLRAVLVDIAGELTEQVAAHLDATERLVLPAVDRHFSAGEWLTLGLRAASWIPLHRMAWMLGAMLEDATETERKQLLAKVPGPARLLYRMVGRDQYAREISALRGDVVTS